MSTPKTTQIRDLMTKAGALSFDEMKGLVAANSRTLAYSDECVIAVCWKESSFIPDATSSTTTAKGLMQMTNPAVDTVNANTPAGVHFDYSDMLIKEKAIQCGTYYLEISFKLAGGTSKADGLNKFSNIPHYADNVLAAEACLQALPAGGDPMTCLNQIHKFILPMAAPEYPIQVCPLTVRDNPGAGFEISEWVTLPSTSEEVEAEITLSIRSSLPLELWGDLSVYARDVEPARFSIQLALKNDEPARLSFPPLTIPSAFLISVHGFASRFVDPGTLRANATITWAPARANR